MSMGRFRFRVGRFLLPAVAVALAVVLSVGDAGADPSEAPPGPARAFAQLISVGRSHICAVLDSGTVTCWGDGSEGELGQGDAKPKFAGTLSDLTTITLAGPIIDSVPTPSGEGYYMLGSDGGVFSFSSQPFSGSLGDNPPDTPIVALTPLWTD
ncbi:MAG TPA: hypothetical protein ENI86_04475 [Acidimicrobiales bacterium]|nr:hypothetical protein [Acidimicrobiales bacterium]